MTIYELYKKRFEKHHSLFDAMPTPTSTDVSLYEFFNTNLDLINNEVISSYENREIYIPKWLYGDDFYNTKWETYYQTQINLLGYKYFTKWELLKIDYDPIENYNRIEETTTSQNGTITNDGKTQNSGSLKSDSTRTPNLTHDITEGVDSSQNQKNKNNQSIKTVDSHSTDTKNNQSVNVANSGANTETRKMSPYDTESFNNDGQTITDLGSNTTTSYSGGADTVDINGTNTVSYEGIADTIDSTIKSTTTTKDKETGTETYNKIDIDTRAVKNDNVETTDIDTTIKSHVHGNIGVTTTQQMLLSSIDLADRLTFIKEFTKELIDNLCYSVYY